MRLKGELETLNEMFDRNLARGWRPAVLGFVLPLCLFPLFAQQTKPPIIRAQVDVVNVLCTVRDRSGRYVDDLTKDDFRVIEDGVEQKIQFFHHEEGEDAQPLTIVLLIDTSGSVKMKLGFEQQAALEFLRQTLRKNKDMAAVVQFDSEISLVQDFTYDYSALKRAIDNIRAGGATKLYDAIWLGANDLLKNEVGRRVEIVLSDGADLASQTPEEDAIHAAQDQDVVIYAIGVEGEGFSADFGTLKRFARDTGGVFFNSKADLDKLREVFAKINQEIKNQYSLVYQSTNKRRDGAFRNLKVEVRRRGLKVTHRKGYYAPSDER